LAENHLKPWQKDMWCIPKVDAEYVARMEDVLDLYAEQLDPKRPAVCFDESPTQVIGEARQPIPAAPGRLERFDYEYRRNGAVSNVTNNRENLSSDAQRSRRNIMKMGAILRWAPFRPRWRWRGPRRLSPSPAPPMRVIAASVKHPAYGAGERAEPHLKIG
jgi:hypothetical protein